jgi:hypothetical protein
MQARSAITMTVSICRKNTITPIHAMPVGRQSQAVGRAVPRHAHALFHSALFMVAPEGVVMLHHRLAGSPVHAHSPRTSGLDWFCLIRH